MKIPKITKRYCATCKKHTEHSIKSAKKLGRSKAHPLGRGALQRMRKRGLRRGYGNYGKYSRPSRPKRTGSKTSKKTDLRYSCKLCGKTSVQKAGFRAKKIEFI